MASKTTLGFFAPATQKWFTQSFAAPTPVQLRGWQHITNGEHALLLAPTGSGKTLAAFLACIDRLSRRTAAENEGVRVLYISPIKALAYDIERNLRAPLVGIARAAEGLGLAMPPLEISVRTGDTPPKQRREFLKRPGQILITTPESLYLMLMSQARENLKHVETVIIDEIHALAPNKRGAHLSLSLERLEALTEKPLQRIGLSATQKPLTEVAKYLGGDRPVAIVDAGEKPRLSLSIEVPTETMEAPPQVSEDERGLWPLIYPRLLELILQHKSTILFTNSRRLCERLAQKLNEMHGDPVPLCRAHHGSVARQQREEIEEQLKSGRLRALVATSSLELGIDMGAVDLVVQIESPGAVSRGLQRIGRAGHSVGLASRGHIFPKHRADLLEAAVVAHRMISADVESTRVPQNPLDVLAQQIVAMCSVETLTVDALERRVKRSYNFHSLTRDVLHAVLDMLSGRYPSDAFADLRPRIVWDRLRDDVTTRRDAKLTAIANAGTIPDRGLFGVYPIGGGARLGELDEEMVHELRTGETFLLGASTWRIEEITRDRVLVSPAPGEPGKMPFWRGEGPGRPIELGRALGAFVRELSEKKESDAKKWLASDYYLDEKAAANLWRFVSTELEATGAVPTDKSITIERFRDELGDGRICILSPFGARVHAPWAIALEAQLKRTLGVPVQTLYSDDGIALRVAETDEVITVEQLIPKAEEIEELLLGELGSSALFASHFRENAGRALLLPRRRPGSRSPLWQQRLKSQALLQAAMQFSTFPIVLETYRECLKDVFDVPALVDLLSQIETRQVRVHEAEVAHPSPFAQSLAFSYVAAYLYEGDAPLAERKAQALTLDRNLLRELLGEEDLASLLSPDILDETEAELQSLAEDRKAYNEDSVSDLLRRVGDLSAGDIAARVDGDAALFTEKLVGAGRVLAVRVGGVSRFIALEDIGLYRDALGVQPPVGVPAIFLEPTTDALTQLVQRYARTHGPFATARIAEHFGLLPAQIEPVLKRLEHEQKLVAGNFRTERGAEWCAQEVLQKIRRRTLYKLRQEIAPVEDATLARFLPVWHGVGETRKVSSGVRVREILAQLEGYTLPFSELQTAVLPARLLDFRPQMLDELGTLGEVVWIGRGALGKNDGKIALYRRDRIGLLLAPPVVPDDLAPLPRAILDFLSARGASFLHQIEQAVSPQASRELYEALWDLVWLGLITNDTFQPLRTLGAPRPKSPAAARRPLGTRQATITTFGGGRWSTVAEVIGQGATPTERAYAQALNLMERYGIVSRTSAEAENLPGGFSALMQVLRSMEESGKVRRGHFVEGLDGAQYAQPGAIDRLRAERTREEQQLLVLAATDPANPYGTLVEWPNLKAGEPSPRRHAGARVVMLDGRPIFYVEPQQNRVRAFDDNADVWQIVLPALRKIASASRHRQLRVAELNGEPVLRSRGGGVLERLGFRVEPSALVLGE